jgi:ferredoxin--NADP+ reductase
MFQIISRDTLGTKIHLFKIEALSIVRKALAGQSVAPRIDERGERIPLTPANWDGKEDSVTWCLWK